MSSAVSLPNNTFTGQAQSSKLLTSIGYNLLLETDKCPSTGKHNVVEVPIMYVFMEK